MSKQMPEGPGRLDHLVTIQRIGYTRTATGESIDAPVDYVTDIWASLQSVSGREIFISAQLMEEVSHELTIYYDDCPDLDNTMWIVHEGQRFDIRYVPLKHPENRPVYFEGILLRQVVGAPGPPDQP